MKNYVILSIFVLFICIVGQTDAQNRWEQFKGPGGMGVSLEDKSLPVHFSTEKNLLWKTEVPFGYSSPCIWDDKIFLTGITGTELEILCLDRKTGDILWYQQAWYEFIERVHRSNSSASPTPATDGQRVYVYLGSCGLLCYDFDGNEIWSRLMPPPPNRYGTAGSLIVAKNKLIFCNDNSKKSTLEAINAETGETIWKVDRSNIKYESWTTPFYWNNNGVDEVIINGAGFMKAYDLNNGEERWSLPGVTYEPCVTPTVGEGMVFVTSYNMKINTEAIRPPKWTDLIAELDTDGDGELTFEETKPNKSILSRYDADGEGDHPLWGFHRFLDNDKNGKITETEWPKFENWINTFPYENALMAVKPDTSAEIVWRVEKGIPEIPSPLYYHNKVYMVKNGGMVTCVDAKTGEVKYRDRLGAGGPYYASPVGGDGKIYTASIRGVVTVFSAGDELNVLARNKLGERIGATPALVDGKIYIRTDKHIYVFGLK